MRTECFSCHVRSCFRRAVDLANDTGSLSFCGPGCTTTTSQPFSVLPRWQKVRQSRATTQPRCIDVSGWVTTSAVQNPPFEMVTVLILSATVARWQPTGATLAEGRSVWDVAVQPGPGHRHDGINVLGKAAHKIRPTPSLRHFPKCYL